MPVPTTTQELLELVRKSELIPQQRLEGFITQVTAARSGAKPREVANLLIAAGLVTQFQAEQFLQGKWRGFTIGKYKVLEPLGSGTRLTLWHNIDRRFIAWGAAGWHIAFDVLDRLLSGTPIGPIGAEGMKSAGWQRLVAEYAKQFAAETPR